MANQWSGCNRAPDERHVEMLEREKSRWLHRRGSPHWRLPLSTCKCWTEGQCTLPVARVTRSRDRRQFLQIRLADWTKRVYKTSLLRPPGEWRAMFVSKSNQALAGSISTEINSDFRLNKLSVKWAKTLNYAYLYNKVCNMRPTRRMWPTGRWFYSPLSILSIYQQKSIYQNKNYFLLGLFLITLKTNNLFLSDIPTLIVPSLLRIQRISLNKNIVFTILITRYLRTKSLKHSENFRVILFNLKIYFYFIYFK